MTPDEITEQFTLSVVREVGSTLIPLCRKDKAGIRHIVGTGFVIQLFERFYLVTARHVNDRRPVVSGVPLSDFLEYAVGPVDWMSVSDIATVSTHPLIKVGLSNLESDIVVFKLHSSFEPTKHMPWGKKTIGYGALLPTRMRRDTAEYIYGGLPASKNEARGSDEPARRPAHYMFLGASPPMEDYQKLGANFETHLLLKFDRVGNVGTLEKGQIFPGPKGMSGGPIFLYRTEEVREKNIGLVAVGIHTLNKEKFLVGTDIALVMVAIEELSKATNV